MKKPLKLVGIIPTRDRPDDLKRLNESISLLETQENIQFRIIIIDNSKHKSAAKVLKESSLPFLHHYIHEAKPGLSRARNAAIPYLQPGEYACTIDDDIILPKDYLLCAASVINKNLTAGIIGGRVELFDSRDLPETIKTSRKRMIFNGVDEVFGFIHGCNMIISYSTFKKIGIFDQKLGAGSKCRSAEDTDFYFRAWNNGLSVVYEPDIYVFHNHGRREFKDKKLLLSNYRIGQGAFYTKHILLGNITVLKFLYWRLKSDFASNPNKDIKKKILENMSEWKDRLKGGLYFLFF